MEAMSSHVLRTDPNLKKSIKNLSSTLITSHTKIMKFTIRLITVKRKMQKYVKIRTD